MYGVRYTVESLGVGVEDLGSQKRGGPARSRAGKKSERAPPCSLKNMNQRVSESQLPLKIVNLLFDESFDNFESRIF